LYGPDVKDLNLYGFCPDVEDVKSYGYTNAPTGEKRGKETGT